MNTNYTVKLKVNGVMYWFTQVPNSRWENDTIGVGNTVNSYGELPQAEQTRNLRMLTSIIADFRTILVMWRFIEKAITSPQEINKIATTKHV